MVKFFFVVYCNYYRKAYVLAPLITVISSHGFYTFIIDDK